MLRSWFSGKIAIAFGAVVTLAVSFSVYSRSRHEVALRQSTPSTRAFEFENTVMRLGLTVIPADALAKLDETHRHDFEVRTRQGMLVALHGVVRSSGGQRGIAAEQAQFTLKGSLSESFDEWRSIVQSSNLPVEIARADVEYADRLLSRVSLKDVRLTAVESGYAVRAEEFRVGPKHWHDVTFTVEKPKTVVLFHFAGVKTGGRPFELRYVPTPGVATEWILEIPSQPLSVLDVPGMSTLPCARATGVLSLVVPENAQLKIRGRLQSVADDCQGPNWPDSSALFGGSISMALSVVPEEDHRAWDLPSVEFTSSMFELRGKGRLVLKEEPELTWDVTGSRSCTQLEANLSPSRYLNQVKAFMSAAKGAAKRAQVTLSMRAKVRGSATLERNLTWHLSGNCGIEDAN